jgi:hypothetical protein
MLQAGLTFEQALDLSPARLKLLGEAAKRHKVGEALTLARVTATAVGAYWAKGGANALKQLDKKLEKATQ